MIFDVLTIFPELIQTISSSSILARAMKKGIITINPINIRDFSTNKHQKVDDYPYGGGQGMVMTPDPIYRAFQSVTSSCQKKPCCIYLSPQGRVFDQTLAHQLMNQENHFVFLCGHYEGIDERVIQEIVDLEISIGDYVLTGGEIPAMVVIDSISRLIPGVLGNEDSFNDDSFSNGILEYPQYTRPVEFNGLKVPEVLLSGHHANIETWRRQQALIRTYKKRPELLEKAILSKEDELFLKNLRNLSDEK